MLKKLYAVLLVITLCAGISGCGNAGDTGSTENTGIGNGSSENTSNGTSISSTMVQNPDTATSPEPGTSPELGTAETTPADAIPKATPDTMPTQKPEPEVEKFSAGQQYSDEYRAVKFLGLKEYKKIEGTKYTDKAKKGKKFLVLFLSARNYKEDDDYINYNYISAKIDGKETKHTFLVNEPKGYPSFFTHVPAGSGIGGFIVWEVPAGWKKLELTYTGWENINNINLQAVFTPEDLSDPVIYNANDFNK